MLIQELKKNLEVQDTYYECFQKQLLAMMDCFEDTNYDILLYFLFQNLYKLFFSVPNLHEQYLVYLNDCNNLIFQVIMFY